MNQTGWRKSKIHRSRQSKEKVSGFKTGFMCVHAPNGQAGQTAKAPFRRKQAFNDQRRLLCPYR